MSTRNRVQAADIAGEVVDLPPSAAARPDQEKPDRSYASPTTQNVVDPPYNSGSQPTLIASTQSAQERQEFISDPTEAGQHYHDTVPDASEGANANTDTEVAHASDAPVLRGVEEYAKDDCYASLEVSEEPVKNANQPDGLSPRLFVGKRTFALKKGTEAQKRARISQATETNGFTDRYDYLKKYPADPPEEGMGDNARVWRVYLDEVEQFDIDMVDNFKDTVDVMLVFAGLFSAVVTTFVAQASTSLQVDYTQVAASAALEQLALLRAFYSGSPLPDPSSSTLSLDSSTTTATDRWVNGLWFTSLSLSLATALYAALIKQWIQAYVSPVSGTPQERARIRQYRYLGLEKWHVYGIVGLLPTLLHLSLFLFLAGLAVFLFPLDHITAKVTASIASSVATIYIFSNLAPVFDSQCPYKTPLSNYTLVLLHPLVPKLRAPLRLSRAGLQALRHTVSTRLRIIHRTMSTALLNLAWSVAFSSYLPRKLANRLEDFLERDPMDARSSQRTKLSQRTSASTLIKKLELDDINLIGDGVDAEALCWVVTWSSNPSVRTVVVEAVGDLSIGYEEQAKDILRGGGVAKAACASLQRCTNWQGWDAEVQSGLEHAHLRAALAHFQLGQYIPADREQHGPYASMTLRCGCINSAWGTFYRSVDGHLGPYFSLLLEPSQDMIRPQHILQSSPPNSPKVVFLLSLRRAALYLRTSPSPTSQDYKVDWSLCQKLCAFVQLVPPLADLFGLWQTTLVSVYLASLVPKVAPIQEDSGLLFELLFNHIKLGSSELSRDLAIELSVQSCMEFLAHTLKNPTAFTDFSSSDGGNHFLTTLSDHLENHRLWVADSDRVVIGPHHTVLVAILDQSEKHGASIPIGLRALMYMLGYNLMARVEPQSSDPELDLVPLLKRLLKAALIPPQLSIPYNLIISQIFCLRIVLDDPPPDSLPVFLDVFMQHDGFSTLEKLIQRAGALRFLRSTNIERSLALYLDRVCPAEDTSMPSLTADITPQSHQDQPGGIDHSAHLDYVLHHLVQVIRICAASRKRRISRSESDSYPRTLQILRRILKTQPEVSPEWNRAFAEVESQGMSPLLSLPEEECRIGPMKENLDEVLSILRSDLQAAHSPGVQESVQSKPLLPRYSISRGVKIEPGTSLHLGPAATEETDRPPTRAESLFSRSTRRLRPVVRRMTTARRVDALIPLHNRAPLHPVRGSEAGASEAMVKQRSVAGCDEEDRDGLPAAGTSAA